MPRHGHDGQRFRCPGGGDRRVSGRASRPRTGSGGGYAARGCPIVPRPRVRGLARGILRNSTLNLVAQGFQSVFNLVVFLVLARTLGKELLGQYYLLFALIMVLQVLLEAGVGTVVTRRLVQAQAVRKETVAEAVGLLSLLVPLSLAVFLALGVVWSWVRGDRNSCSPGWPRGSPTAACPVSAVCDGVFRAFDQFGYESAGKIPARRALRSGSYWCWSCRAGRA